MSSDIWAKAWGVGKLTTLRTSAIALSSVIACLVATTSGAAVAVPAAMAERPMPVAFELISPIFSDARRAALTLSSWAVCWRRVAFASCVWVASVPRAGQGRARRSRRRQPGGQLCSAAPPCSSLCAVWPVWRYFLELGPQLLRGASVASSCWRRAASLACKASYWRVVRAL
jgi:hypothetical protein